MTKKKTSTESGMLPNLHPTFPPYRISLKDTRRGKRREQYRGEEACARRSLKREFRDSVGFSSLKQFQRGWAAA